MRFARPSNLLGTMLLLLLAMTAGAGGAEPAPAGPAAQGDYATTVRPLLQRYCYDCHGPDKQKAQVRYDRIDGYRVEEQRLWAMAHDRLLTGEMPPEDHAQPTDAERRTILSWVEREATAARKLFGAGSTRRLNRRELAGALRDVTGLSVDFADALPGDGKVAGFDTGATGLQDAADSVDSTMRVARRAVDGIRFLEPARGEVFAVDLRAAEDPRKALESWKAKGLLGKPRNGAPGKGLLLEPRWVEDRDKFNINVPPPPGGRGIIRLKLTVSMSKPSASIPNPRLWVEVGGKDIDYAEVTAPFEAPAELVYEVQVDDLPVESKGIVLSLSNKVEVPYAVDGFENEDTSRDDKEKPPGPAPMFRPKFERNKIPPEQQPAPFIVLQKIEIDPDYVAAWPPANWAAQGGAVSDDAGSAKRLLQLWAERAWRRPVAEADLGRFLSLYTSLREQRMSFDDALRATFQAVLLSSGFRYLASPGDPDEAVAQHAIASRLSFMLWAAPPDDALRALAAQGKLREPAVLDAQVDRLLADPRAGAFFAPFVTQWLELEQPITVAMDHIKRQDFRFGRHLKASMREQTVGYVRQLFADNRPARELVQSDWTMMNDILAIHYGYPSMPGGELRKVTMRADDPRGGGLLGHAGIQSMLCWMGDNWVIYRGAWALRHVLDDPPPPAPLEVPELVPSEGKNKGKTFRELLVQHQADANCTVCHKKMDPLGFAFQNFDLSGRWRDVEFESYARSELDGKIEWRGVGKTRPVDAAGQLPRGEPFTSFAECRQLIGEKYQDDVVRGVMKNLVLYAAGRQADVRDMSDLRAMMKEQGARGYPLRDLLKALLRSRVFLEP